MKYKIITDIRIIMELLNITKSDFASEIGVSRMSVDNWLSGKKEISTKHIESIYEFAFKKGIRLNKIKEQFYREEISKEETYILLYHGSKTQINGKVSLKFSDASNDFGKGFYCGETLEQSAMFVSAYPNSSLYVVKFNTEGMKFKKFNVDLDWMLTIAYFRGLLQEYKDSASIKKLVKELKDIDYIVAPIADNRMFEIIDQFAQGEITDVQCEHCLSATNLGNQYVMITQGALSKIKLLERSFLPSSEKDYYLNSRREDYNLSCDKVKIAKRKYRNKGRYIEEILK